MDAVARPEGDSIGPAGGSISSTFCAVVPSASVTCGKSYTAPWEPTATPAWHPLVATTEGCRPLGEDVHVADDASVNRSMGGGRFTVVDTLVDAEVDTLVDTEEDIEDDTEVDIEEDIEDDTEVDIECGTEEDTECDPPPWPDPPGPFEFSTNPVPTTAAASRPAAAGTQRGNSGTKIRVPDRRVAASGFGASALIEKDLGSGRPNQRRDPYTETGTSTTLPGGRSAKVGTPIRSPSAASAGFSVTRSGTLPRLSKVI